MAENEETDGTAEDGGEEAKGGKSKLIIFGAIGVVLIAVGVFAGPMIMNMISPPPEEEAAAEAEPVAGPALYQTLHPPMVVTFNDAVGDAHVMQVTIDVMSREQTVINAIREHTPAIRNSLILLLSSATYEEVRTRAGKEKMLADSLEEIRRVMTEADGTESTEIEAAYFTSLVIQ
ncbi:MAG: flagellar basal body-associated FliL family protein [Pseudomonadota bacterium]